MNVIISTSILVGDNIMPVKHPMKPGFTYRACGTLKKNKERIQKFKFNRRLEIYLSEQTRCGL